MKKILVVDDDKDIVEVVSIILKSRGYKVFTYSTGIGVDGIVHDIEPDLILLDIQLPGKMGTQVCKELKDMNKHPAIILFSAHAKEGEAFSECNANAFIQKPFDVKHLLSVINDNLSATSC